MTWKIQRHHPEKLKQCEFHLFTCSRTETPNTTKGREEGGVWEHKREGRSERERARLSAYKECVCVCVCFSVDTLSVLCISSDSTYGTFHSGTVWVCVCTCLWSWFRFEEYRKVVVKLSVLNIYVNDFTVLLSDGNSALCVCVWPYQEIQCRAVCSFFPCNRLTYTQNTPLNNIHIYSPSLPVSNHPLHTHTPCLLACCPDN